MPKSQQEQLSEKEKNEELESTKISFAPGKWLNDKEIEWVYLEIKKECQKNHSFISVYEFPLLKTNTDFLVNARMLSELADTSKELVFIPVNNPNTHWSLLVYEIKNNKFYHLDSSKKKLNEQYIKDVIEHLCQHKDAAFEDVNDRPLQPNADDCGVYLLTFTKLLSQNPELLRNGIPEIDSEKERSYWANKRRNAKLVNWKERGGLFLDFTEEITQKWAKCDFNREQTKEWLNIGLTPNDAEFAKWLRDTKKVKTEQALDHGQLRKEYQKYSISRWRGKKFSNEEIATWRSVGLGLPDGGYAAWMRDISKITPAEYLNYLSENNNDELLREQHQIFLAERKAQKKVAESSTNWKNIHPDFTPELQKKWEGQGFDYQTAKSWIDVGLTLQDSAYGAWLRDIKNLSTEQVLNNGNEKALREEYNNDLVATQQLLNKSTK